MANTKEIQKRMKSIQDTMKITSAMYMISSAKLRSAKQKLENTEPYFYALQSAISRLLRHIPDAKSRYFDQHEEIPDDKKRRGYIVITADKGLAGAYNHNVIKMAHELFEQGENNKLFVVGELGRQYFTKEGLEEIPSLNIRCKILPCTEPELSQNVFWSYTITTNWMRYTSFIRKWRIHFPWKRK